MGAHTCQYGTVHKTCRCLKQHTMNCPTPDRCAPPTGGKHKADVPTDSPSPVVQASG